MAGQLSAASQIPSPSESPPPPIAHTPASQTSGSEQATPDPLLHTAPSTTGFPVHSPVSESQLVLDWHCVGAPQITGLEPTQPPAWQVSLSVHASPSLQAVPSGRFGVVHAPVTGSQVPADVH